MAKKQSRGRQGPDRRLEPTQLPTRAQVTAAKVRQRRRTTKPAGLRLRERELVSAQRELETLRATGVARKGQTAPAEARLKSAQLAVKRQQAAARRAGRPVNRP